MPYYTFENISTGKTVDIFFHMNDIKEYHGENGKETNQWKRVWLKPQASIDTTVDPYSAKDFVKATNKNGTIGDMFDRSMDMHLRRKDKEGVDPVREKHYDNYEKKHSGVIHPEKKKEIGRKKLKDMGIKADFRDD